jgi:RNase_H superfamily
MSLYRTPYTEEQKDAFLKRVLAGDSMRQIQRETGLSRDTLQKWMAAYLTKHGIRNPRHQPPQSEREKINIYTKKSLKILIFDLELLPNSGFFYDRFSDFGIPQQFIRKTKALCAIGYKWFGDDEVTVLATKKPYEDYDILKKFAPIWEQADYVVAHNGDAFDIKALGARYKYHNLPPLPPVASIDTLRLARQKWGQFLNGNGLDHLAEMAGLGRKLKIDASLWVRCAEGDKAAMAEMIEYNRQDVNLLELVFADMLSTVKHKINHNLFIDSPVKVCKTCGHDDLEHKGYELTAATYRHRYRCKACNSWSTQPKGKGRL